MARKQCKGRRCQNLVAKNRSGTERRDGFCNTCRSRAWRAANPMRHAWNNLKTHARERGKTCTISFEDFKAFALRVDYIDKKGIKKDGFHIDRINETKGYVKGNLQLLTNAENNAKYRKHIEQQRSFTRDVHGHKWQAAYPHSKK